MTCGMSEEIAECRARLDVLGDLYPDEVAEWEIIMARLAQLWDMRLKAGTP